MEVLNRLEKRQLEQQNQMNHLLRVNGVPTIESIPDPEDMNFEESFQNFLLSYARISQQERSNKIRKLSSSAFFGDFLEMCTMVSNQVPLYIPIVDNYQLSDASIADTTSQSSQVEWESLYNEIFSSPDVSPGM